MRNRGRGRGPGPGRRHHRRLRLRLRPRPRPHLRSSFFLFSDRSDNAGDGSDARTMAIVTREGGREGEREREGRANCLPGSSASLPVVGWAGNRNILNFIHERAGAGPAWPACERAAVSVGLGDTWQSSHGSALCDQ